MFHEVLFHGSPFWVVVYLHQLCHSYVAMMSRILMTRGGNARRHLTGSVNRHRGTMAQPLDLHMAQRAAGAYLAAVGRTQSMLPHSCAMKYHDLVPPLNR